MSELNVQNQQLSELEPIDPTITVINCIGNRLETLPELPPVLLVLNCSHNPLRKLPTLPSSIQSLDCTGTYIRSLNLLPTLLNLTRIHCDSCDLPEIPLLPPNVTELSCSDNPISELKEPLPAGLLTLMCNRCYLDRLPELPDSLVYLECRESGVRELPTLPSGLTDLHCQNNFLETLPELPDSLVDLYCEHNEIRELPTLPNGIETVECDFNLIRNLPPLPDSLYIFKCTHNPLTRESFDILRETFPEQQYRPEDFPDGFMEAEVEPAPVSASGPAEEMTEGDVIEARNIAVQQEVHDAFDKINVSKLYPVIESGSTPKYDPAELMRIIQELVESNTLDDIQERRHVMTLFEQFRGNITTTLYRCVADSTSQRLLTSVLHFVIRQNPEFKNNYIRFLIQDISSAYEFNPEIPDLDTASCSKGIKERIIMSLKSATIGQTETYQPLLRAFVHKIPIDIMRQFTSDCMRDASVQEMLKATPNMDKKVRILADCIREKLRTTEYFPTSRGAEEIPDPPEFASYIGTLRYGLEGGTKKRNKQKKTRKLKKMKTKRKVKKLKVSKRNK